MEGGGEPVPVLHQQRIVEVELVADMGDSRRRGVEPPGQGDRRVARESTNRKKTAKETIRSTGIMLTRRRRTS